MDDERLFDSDSEDDGERPRIKVTDRRQFDREGKPKSAAREEPTVTAEAEVEGRGTKSEETAGPTASPAADAEASAPPEGDAGATRDAAGGESPGTAADQGSPRISAPIPSLADLPRDFSAFVEGMYLEAMLYLGAIADPRTGETIEDPELAKYKIDLLGMLQDKTEGNLDVEEKQQLEEALYQLRMIFLQKTQAMRL
jgi:hypothetical protein